MDDWTLGDRRALLNSLIGLEAGQFCRAEDLVAFRAERGLWAHRMRSLVNGLCLAGLLEADDDSAQVRVRLTDAGRREVWKYPPHPG